MPALHHGQALMHASGTYGVITPAENPFRDPHAKPRWAELTRLAGDRAAILFEDLRRRLAGIDGLQEELFYAGPDDGWLPRYKAGEQVLFSAHILPGALEASIELEAPLRDRALASPRVAAGIKEALRRAALAPEGNVRLRLSSASLVRSFARLVLMKSRFDNRRQGGGQCHPETPPRSRR